MAEVPEVDYTAEEEAAMGGETQPEGETPSVKTPEGVEADPTEVSTSAKPLEAVKQESRDNQAVTTPGKTAQEEVGTSKGASSSGQENPGQTGVEPEQGEYWQYSKKSGNSGKKRSKPIAGRTANGGNPTKTCMPKGAGRAKGSAKRSSARRSLQVNGGQ